MSWTTTGQPGNSVYRSVSVSRHFLLQAPHCHCWMWKRFSRDHCCRGRSKPSCQIVGSHTRWELTTWANFSYAFDFWCQLVASPVTAASWMSVIEMVGWEYQAGLAFCRRAGSSMLESTGSHGRGVERRVPVMRCMVEFNFLTEVLQHWGLWWEVVTPATQVPQACNVVCHLSTTVISCELWWHCKRV